MTTLTVEEAVKIAVRCHPSNRTENEYKQCILSRPRSWFSWCEDALKREKVEAKTNAKPRFTLKQKELLEFIQDKPEWKSYFDCPMERYEKSLKSLIKRGFVNRVDYGSFVVYRITHGVLG